MTWQTEMVPIVRYLINDATAPYTYEDSRIQQTIAIAAQLTLITTSFDKDYVVDVATPSITPDPTDETRDDAFISLVSIQAACIILGAEVKTASQSSVRIQDGPHTIDLTGGGAITVKRWQDMCAKFDAARKQYLGGNSKNGQAVIGPYTIESVPIMPWNF